MNTPCQLNRVIYSNENKFSKRRTGKVFKLNNLSGRMIRWW